MGFRLEPTSTGIIALILSYSTDFGSFGANYIKVDEDRPILFARKI